MSAIYFHSQEHKDAFVRGSERAYMGCLTTDIMIAVLGDLKYAEPWLKPLFAPDHYIQRATEYQFAQHVETLLKVGMGTPLHLPAGSIEPWIVALNTALVVGGDALKLFARLHGQCEVHCWVEGAPDKRWLSNVLEVGLAKGPMRSDQGWDSVIKLLRLPGDFPVVCSYSVCESFPNFGSLPANHPLKERTDEERWEAFYEIPKEEAWSLCMAGLRARDGLRLTRRNWRDFQFADGTSAFNLRERASRKPEAA